MIGKLMAALWQFHLDRTKRRWPKFKSPTFAANRLAFHHAEFGFEEFEIETARFNVYQGDDGIWELVVKVDAGAVTDASELQEVATGSLAFEATALLPADDTEIRAGRVIIQPEGYDRLRGLNLSNIFYLTHEPVEELRIEVQEVLPQGLKARVSGECVINGSLLTHPDAKFSVEAEFSKDPSMRRGIK